VTCDLSVHKLAADLKYKKCLCYCI